METFLYLTVLSLGIFNLVTASCPAVCECLATPPLCPPGVNAVADRCGCCKVCAAQLNEDCGPSQPCDHHKGLECNYGNGASHAHGICRAREEGRTCEHSGRLYQSGESFQLGCKHHCTCVDGGVGCTPLCPAHMPPTTPACPAPRLVRVPGRCCPTLDCRKKAEPYNFLYPFQHKTDKALGNELIEVKTEEKHGENKQEYKKLAAWQHTEHRCAIQTAQWSSCSRSCGMGVSSRVTNDNALCKLLKEMRLCTIRPCGTPAKPPKKGKECLRTRKSPESRPLIYGRCRSVQLYRLNYCGTCADGRCCLPRRTHTGTVLFTCSDGRRFERSVVFVLSCQCTDDCGYPNEVAPAPRQRLRGDTRKFLG